MIIVPKRELILPTFALPKSLMRGRYVLEALNVTDGRRRKLADFPNLITTNGANLYGTTALCIGTCAVGSGSNAPALTDTALQTLVASTTTLGPAGAVSSASGTGGPTYWGMYTVQYAFGAGAATGNLSEVGVGASATNLFSRALILDGGGSPTTITVLSTEALYVTYSYQQYAPTADVTGNVVIAGTNYAYTLRAANAGAAQWQPAGQGFRANNGALASCSAWNGALGLLTAQPTGTLLSMNTQSQVTNSYSAGSFQLTATLTCNLGDANNAGGVNCFLINFQTHGQYQIQLTPAIPKDASHILTLNFGHSWAVNSP